MPIVFQKEILGEERNHLIKFFISVVAVFAIDNTEIIL